MTEIIATNDQAAIISQSAFPIVLRDAAGKLLGKVIRWSDDVFSPDDLAEIKRRAVQPGPRYTTAELLAHLRTLAPE